jgi:hypothetical protein
MDLGVPQITSHDDTPNLAKYLILGGLDLTVIWGSPDHQMGYL